MPLFCRITVNGEEVRFGMKTDINPKFWETNAGKATGRTNQSVEINNLIDNTKSAIYKVYRELQERDNIVTAEKVKNGFLGMDNKQQNLLELFDKHNKDVERLIGISKTRATYKKYDVTRRYLAMFIKERYNVTDISLKEINHTFICDFEVFLLTSRRCSANTTAKFMQFFKRIVIIARNNGWIHTNPFANYKIQIKSVDRGYLTQEEVEIIMNKKFETQRLEKVRDIFIFCCFTGLAYIDVKNLRKDDIQTSFDGGLWLIKNRGKTDIRYSVPLLEIPKMILEKYRGKSGNRALPVINNQNTNAYVKEIGTLCGINKNITFHMSRHTFATLTLSKGVSIESVSKMLGHTNIQTTQIYARITNEKISNDMAAFAGKVKDMETKFAVNF